MYSFLISGSKISSNGKSNTNFSLCLTIIFFVSVTLPNTSQQIFSLLHIFLIKLIFEFSTNNTSDSWNSEHHIS